MALSTDKLRSHDRHRRIVQPPDDVRRRALARLYEHRSAVDNLIGALERYKQEQRGLRAQHTTGSTGEMSS